MQFSHCPSAKWDLNGVCELSLLHCGSDGAVARQRSTLKALEWKYAYRGSSLMVSSLCRLEMGQCCSMCNFNMIYGTIPYKKLDTLQRINQMPFMFLEPFSLPFSFGP